jgi:hypothetical protein
MTAPTVTRINPGIYDIRYNGRRYELEQYPDGNWLLFEAAKNDHSNREYMQDFTTKRAALASLKAEG